MQSFKIIAYKKRNVLIEFTKENEWLLLDVETCLKYNGGFLRTKLEQNSIKLNEQEFEELKRILKKIKNGEKYDK